MKAAESTDRGVNNAQRGDGISMSSLAAAAGSSSHVISTEVSRWLFAGCIIVEVRYRKLLSF